MNDTLLIIEFTKGGKPHNAILLPKWGPDVSLLKKHARESADSFPTIEAGELEYSIRAATFNPGVLKLTTNGLHFPAAVQFETLKSGSCSDAGMVDVQKYAAKCGLELSDAHLASKKK